MNKPLVVITGASSGFGLEMAKEFAKDGYPLLLLARTIEKHEELNSPTTILKNVDVTDRKMFESVVREAENKFGKTDLLVNNAGVMLLGEIEDQDPEEWEKMLNLNVLSVMHGSQIVIPDMQKRKSGTIINISSIAGLKPFPRHAAYCASKYAVTGFTQVIREALSPYNVRVLLVSPGAVPTGLLDQTTNDQIKKDYRQWTQNLGVNSITATDVAKSVKFAYEMPQGVSLREFIITDTKQDG